MKPSTLLVDARPLDHPTARQRGIGRYVTGLLTGLRDIGAPAVALYGTDAEADALTRTVPGLAAQRWSPEVIGRHATDGAWYIATQLMLHPIPLDPIPRCITAARLPVAAVMYDVIPYRYPEIYLTDPNARRQAELRAPLARTTDALLAISDFAADTAAVELSYPRDRIVTIGAGVEPKFTPSVDDPRARCARVLPDPVRRYVVAIAGADERKNTAGLLRAWVRVHRAFGDAVHLVIVGAHSPAVLQQWRGWAADAGVLDRVVFTGGLDDDELVALLQGAALAVMPSLEEGFGLPVLEAAACGVPTLASNVSSLPEVLDEPAACFDPHDSDAIGDAIVRALDDEAHRAVLLAAGRRAAQRWTWPNVATAAMVALDSLGRRWSQHVRTPPVSIAIAGRVGTADRLGTANAAVVTALRAAGAAVEVFVDPGRSPEPTHATPDRWPVRAVGRYVKPWDVDHVVAVLGAGQEHLATSAMARTSPCHLWIHDDALVGVRFGANLQALEIARSAIVSSIEAAELIRRAADRPCPILVVPADLDAPEVAAVILAWLGDVARLDPSTIRRASSPVASADP